MAKLTDTDAHVLAILHDHGATGFSEPEKVASAQRLLKSGHVIAYGAATVSITAKGVNWLSRQHGPL